MILASWRYEVLPWVDFQGSLCFLFLTLLMLLQVTWRPWELPPVPDPEAYEAARSLVLKRIVFHGPTGPVWYLGERATDKWPGFQGWVIPESPPRHMSDPGRLSVTDLLLAEAGREGHELIRLCSYEEWCEYRRRELACEPLSPGGHEVRDFSLSLLTIDEIELPRNLVFACFAGPSRCRSR